MRIVQIDPELFLYKLDADQFKFYRKNRNALKKMWTAQGSTYWLRFLLTFQLSFEDYISKHIKLSAFVCAHYERHIPDFVYIRIHKQFVEATFDKVEAFLENVFRIVQNFHKAAYHPSDNAAYSEESLDHFNDAVEHTDSEKIIYSGIVSLLCIMYSGFVDGLLKLLKKWQKEPDVSKDKEKNIDLTIYYWRPQKSWECKKFTPTCFEKYLATYWAENLPKLLLTCNVHDIFSTHAEDEDCSCQYKNEESIFGLLKDKYKYGKPASLSVVHIYKPETAMCQDHNNCHIKLQHGKECLEPYICLGFNSSCTKTCETALKIRRKGEAKDFWKKSIVEVFSCKKGNKRNVSTYVESCDTQIETFCPLNENRKKQVCLDLEELFYCNYDPNFRNSYVQHKRKEEYRQKLRKKLYERYDYDCQDSDQLKEMYDEAQRLWLNEICFENYRELFALRRNEPCDFDKALFKVKKSLTTVAIGTSSIVFGRVVLPTKPSPKKDCTTEVKVSISTQKNSKKKKKKSVISTTTTTEITQVKITSESVTNSTPNLTSNKNMPETKVIDIVSSSCSESDVVDNKEKSKSIEISSCNPEKLNKFEKIQSNGSKLCDREANQLSCDKLTESNSRDTKLINCERTADFFSQDTKILGCEETTKLCHLNESDETSVNTVVEGSKLSASENPSDVDDELNTFFSFVVNEEDKADDPNNGTVHLLDEMTANSNATCGKTTENTIVVEESMEKNPSDRKSKLKICAYCLKKEIIIKSFKRCSRCKAENLPDQYFYCSRDCQVADWEKSHRELHVRARTNN